MSDDSNYLNRRFSRESWLIEERPISFIPLSISEVTRATRAVNSRRSTNEGQGGRTSAPRYTRREWPAAPSTDCKGVDMFLSAKAIAQMAGQSKPHFLNPSAV